MPEAGWAGTKNGQLLRLAAAAFDVFVTVDGNLVAQQGRIPLGVLVLKARTNRLADLRPLIPEILLALESLEPGTVVTVGG